MQFYRNYMIDNDLPLVSEKYLVGVLYIEVKSSKQRIGSSGQYDPHVNAEEHAQSNMSNTISSQYEVASMGRYLLKLRMDIRFLPGMFPSD